MKLWRSKCFTCGSIGYVFPHQIATIKRNSKLALYPYVQNKLSVGSPWYCIACDRLQSDGKNCKIIAELTGEDARKKSDIIKRQSSLLAKGWTLPKLT